MGQHVAGRAAEDHLAQPALRVATLDDEVGADLPCLVEDGRSLVRRLAFHRDRLGHDIVTGERAGQLFAGRAGYRVDLERLDHDATGAAKQR